MGLPQPARFSAVLAALDEVLAPLGLSQADAGGSIEPGAPIPS
ncbi:MAG TPA: hypothetical protein VF481_03615 [Novosphingobium sp.]